VKRLDPPGVLLERSFIDALIDDTSANHHAARQCYASLLDDYQAERILLKVLAPDRQALTESSEHSQRAKAILTPATTIRIARQHRLAARRVAAHADVALVLVIVDRHRLGTIASFDARFSEYDVRVVPSMNAPAEAGSVPAEDHNSPA